MTIEMIVPGQFRGPEPEPGPEERPTWTTSWNAWGTTASVTVTDPAKLVAARRLVARQVEAAERTAARHRPDAEIHKLYRAAGRTLTVSPLLAEFVAAALIAAERTGGDVDPTVAAAVTRVHGRPRGLGKELGVVPVCGSQSTGARPAAGYEAVVLQGRRLRVPVGVTLDLTATAKALTADRAAAAVHERLGVGVLVGVGGDVASAGEAPAGGWSVKVEDRDGNHDTRVDLPAGAALATSHLVTRMGGDHLVDPRTGRTPTPVWRAASAIGFTAVEAATYTAAALVRGTSARGWLGQLWVPARLIDVHDDVVEVGPWAVHADPRRTTLR